MEPEQLADPVVPTDRWEQDVPSGGALPDGTAPHRALAVVPVGIADVRSVPTLDGATGAVPVAIAQVTQLLGRVPQRRRVLISGTESFSLALNKTQADADLGFIVPADYVVELTTASPVWVKGGATAGTVSFLAELDLG